MLIKHSLDALCLFKCDWHFYLSIVLQYTVVYKLPIGPCIGDLWCVKVVTGTGR